VENGSIVENESVEVGRAEESETVELSVLVAEQMFARSTEAVRMRADVSIAG